MTDGTWQSGQSKLSGRPDAISIMPADCETQRDNRGYGRWQQINFRDDHMKRATFGYTPGAMR